MAFYKSMIYDSIDVNDIIFAKYCYPNNFNIGTTVLRTSVPLVDIDANDIIFAKYCYPNNFNIGTTVLRTSVPYSPVVTVKYLGV